VRENNQTYRLGWTEQCKDATKMGAGMPEYLLLMRKPPSDNSRSYADLPVVKSKDRYTRARWQFDAHGFQRSSGNRRLMPDELTGLEQQAIFKLFRQHSIEQTYDFEHDVRLAEHIDASGWLPSTFMLLQPQSWHPDVWTDITRMRTLNSAQSAKGKEMHLCPMQIDLADRVIEQFSMPGETVLDPFAGLMTVVERAIRLDRIGVGIELSTPYFLDGATYCEAAEREVSMPSLFDLMETGET
jgi:DNA modification methylase